MWVLWRMIEHVTNIDELQELSNRLLNRISLALFIVDQQRRLRAANAAFTGLFDNLVDNEQPWGYVVGCRAAVDAPISNPAHFHECQGCGLKDGVDAALTSGKSTHAGQMRRQFVIASNTVLRCLQYSIHPVTYAGERMAAIILEDVTRLDSQNRRLEDLNRLKNEFLGMVAHDLRNPISLVRGFSSILREKVVNNLKPNEQQMLETICTQSDYALFLLDDLLDISEFESGKVRLDLERIDYVQLLHEVIKLNQPFTARKSMSVFVSCREDLPPLTGDRRKIEQVLNNLISNAIKFANPNTTIQVAADLDDSGCLVTKIKDQGPGISESDQQRIFQSFERSSTKPTGGERSTGLGLMIAKKIVDAHGGSIAVSSQPRQGAEFSFKLPLAGPLSEADNNN